MKEHIKLFYKAMLKGVFASFATVLVYQFFYVEFIRSSVEDAAFDAMNWMVLSKTTVENKSPNTFVLMVDDKYLRSKQLLDDNNETRYGYLFPRGYIAKIIEKIDVLVHDIDSVNNPKALFIDYDFSYLSDPLNITKSIGDQALLDMLKKDRPYTIYLPITNNHNFIYHSQDKKIQALIEAGNIEFVSVGLTTASDSISRRYYPYEKYKNKLNEEVNFHNVAIALWNKDVNNNSVKSSFNQDGLSLIENRIIVKDYATEMKNQKYFLNQSNWENLQVMSANRPLDEILSSSLKDAVFMLGAGHSLSGDTFEIDAFSKEISGIEMHANALMTLQYLNGKLHRLDMFYSIAIIFLFITLIDFTLGILFKSMKKSREKLCSYFFETILLWLVPNEQDDFQDKWLLVWSMGILFVVSYYLLVEYHIWFNWMIPSLMSIPLIFIIFLGRKFSWF